MNVYLSPEAESQLEALLFYLEAEWGIKVHDNFLEKLDHAIQTIRKMPTAYPASTKYPELRKCVVTRQTLLFYRLSGDDVEVVSLIDSRQNI